MIIRGTSKHDKQEIGTRIPTPPDSDDEDEEVDEGRRCLSAMSVEMSQEPVMGEVPQQIPVLNAGTVSRPSPLKPQTIVRSLSQTGCPVYGSPIDDEELKDLYDKALKTLPTPSDKEKTAREDKEKGIMKDIPRPLKMLLDSIKPAGESDENGLKLESQKEAGQMKTESMDEECSKIGRKRKRTDSSRFPF